MSQLQNRFERHFWTFVTHLFKGPRLTDDILTWQSVFYSAIKCSRVDKWISLSELILFHNSESIRSSDKQDCFCGVKYLENLLLSGFIVNFAFGFETFLTRFLWLNLDSCKRKLQIFQRKLLCKELDQTRLTILR